MKQVLVMLLAAGIVGCSPSSNSSSAPGGSSPEVKPSTVTETDPSNAVEPAAPVEDTGYLNCISALAIYKANGGSLPAAEPAKWQDARDVYYSFYLASTQAAKDCQAAQKKIEDTLEQQRIKLVNDMKACNNDEACVQALKDQITGVDKQKQDLNLESLNENKIEDDTQNAFASEYFQSILEKLFLPKLLSTYYNLSADWKEVQLTTKRTHVGSVEADQKLIQEKTGQVLNIHINCYNAYFGMILQNAAGGFSNRALSDMLSVEKNIGDYRLGANIRTSLLIDAMKIASTANLKKSSFISLGFATQGLAKTDVTCNFDIVPGHK